MSDSDSDISVDDTNFRSLFSGGDLPTKPSPPEKQSNDYMLLEEIEKSKKQEEDRIVLQSQLDCAFDSLSQEVLVLPELNGQFMFDHYAIKPIPIERPKITEMECKECEFLLDLEMIFEAACYESPKFFYKNLIQTDLLKEIDSFHTLPQSVYFMLFSIAIGSEDESSSIRATDLLLSLLSNHSGHPLSLNLCLPPSSVLCSTWSSFGMTGQHPLDLQTYCTNHPELTSVLLNDGSIDISLFETFPLLRMEQFLQILLFVVSKMQVDDIYFSEQQLEDLLVNVMLILIDPRLIVLYDLICNLLAAIVMSMYKRGIKFTKAIQRIVSVEAIPKTNCLGLLLLRIPLVNPVLIVFRSVLSFYVLRRLQ